MIDERELDRIVAEAKALDHPPRGAQAQAWALLSARLGGPAPSVPPATGGPGAALTATLKIAALVAGVLGGGTTGLALGWSRMAHDVDPSPVSVSAPVVHTSADRAVAAPRTMSEIPTVNVASEDPPPRRPRAVHHEEARPSEVSSTLAAEVALLGRAWRAIEGEDLEQAQALVDEHHRRFPSSAVATERRACAIVLACARGETEGLAEAERFLSQHPGMSAARVRLACRIPTANKSSRD